MISNLIIACGLACGVALPSTTTICSIEPYRAITSETTFNVGDIYNFEYDLILNDSVSLELLSHSDSGINTLKFLGYSISSPYSLSYEGVIPCSIDFCFIYVGYDLSFNEDYELILLECDNDLDSFSYSLSSNIYLTEIASIKIVYTFEILEGFEGFSDESMSYLTKLETPYTPPSKSNLYRLLYDFYYSIFSDDDLSSISTGYNMPFDNWLAHTCTIVTLLTLIVVAFFFLRWLFKVISGLILLKR